MIHALIMAHEKTVLIGTVIFADFRAASKFCMLLETPENDLVACGYVPKFTAVTCGITLLATHV